MALVQHRSSSSFPSRIRLASGDVMNIPPNADLIPVADVPVVVAAETETVSTSTPSSLVGFMKPTLVLWAFFLTNIAVAGYGLSYYMSALNGPTALSARLSWFGSLLMFGTFFMLIIGAVESFRYYQTRMLKHWNILKYLDNQVALLEATAEDENSDVTVFSTNILEIGRFFPLMTARAMRYGNEFVMPFTAIVIFGLFCMSIAEKPMTFNIVEDLRVLSPYYEFIATGLSGLASLAWGGSATTNVKEVYYPPAAAASASQTRPAEVFRRPYPYRGY